MSSTRSNRKKTVLSTCREACLVGLTIAVLGLHWGCTNNSPSSGEPLALMASNVRAERRLYDGAPPVIPHAPLNITCTACHTETGKRVDPLGLAPANPHSLTVGMGETTHCQQCHVFRRGEGDIVASEFAGLRQSFQPADRLYPGAPPVIPHRVFMRENCAACHGGPVARPEIRCTHPERANCRQCHVPVEDSSSEPALASASS